MKKKSSFLFFYFFFSGGHLFALTDFFDQAFTEISSSNPNFSLPQDFEIELTQFLFGKKNLHLSPSSDNPKEGFLVDWATHLFLKNYIEKYPDHPMNTQLIALCEKHGKFINDQMTGLSLQETGSGHPNEVIQNLLTNAYKAFFNPFEVYSFSQGKNSFFRILPEHFSSWSGINPKHVVSQSECLAWYFQDMWSYCFAFFQLTGGKRYVRSLKDHSWEQDGLSISYWDLYSFFVQCVLILHKQQTHLFPIQLDQTPSFQEIRDRFQIIQQKLSESPDLSWKLVASILEIYEEDGYTFSFQRDSDLFLFPFLPVVYFFYRNLLAIIINKKNHTPKLTIYSHWRTKNFPQAHLKEYLEMIRKNDFQLPDEASLPGFFKQSQNPFLQIYVALQSVLRAKVPLNQNHEDLPLAREFLLILFQYSYPAYYGDRLPDYFEIQQGAKSSWNDKIYDGINFLFQEEKDLAFELNNLLSTLLHS